MSKFDEVVDACKQQMDKCGIACDDKLLLAIAKSLGPSIYNKDSSLVAASNQGEMDNIRTKFIAGKLGVQGGDAEAALTHAIEALGSSNRQKLRPVFYYLIVKHLGKESVYA